MMKKLLCRIKRCLLPALLIASVMVTVLPSAAGATDSWYDNNWNYRQKFTITGTSGDAVTNYQMQMVVQYGNGSSTGSTCYVNGHSKTDFGDVRFTQNDGTTLLDYWMETYTSSTSATFWIEFNSIPASPSTVYFYIYYGYGSATTTSSSANTFVRTIANTKLAWSFDEASGNAIDNSGNSNTGTFGNGMTRSTVQLRWGNSAYTDGTGDKNVQAASSASLNPTGSAVSWDTWIYLNSVTGERWIVGKGAGWNRDGYTATTGSGAQIKQILGGSGADHSISNGSLSISTWYHVLNTWDGTTQKTYINGTLQGTTGTPSGITLTSSVIFIIGVSDNGGELDCNAYYDDVHMWNAALTQDDATALSNTAYSPYSTTNSADKVYIRNRKTTDPTFTSWVAEESILDPPVITTSTGTVTGETTATLNGNLSSLGDYSPVYVYFQYGLNTSYGTSTSEQSKTSTGSFTQAITSLSASTTYHFRAAVHYGTLYSYGDDATFRTPPTTLLYPESAGAETALYPSVGSNWDCVDETPISYGDYVHCAGVYTWLRDLYNLSYTEGGGAITQVTVWVNAKADGTAFPRDDGAMYLAVKSGSVVGTSAYNIGLPQGGNPAYYAYTWLTNPATGVAWTWSDISSLQAGVALRSESAVQGINVFVYQLYVEVTSSVAPVFVTQTASSVTGTSATLNGNLQTLGNETSVYAYFEYGLTTSYGTTTSEQTKTSIGSVTQSITGLVPLTTYYYRTVLRYQTSIYAYGSAQSFATTNIILRPVGAGDETGIQFQTPGTGYHWDKVDEVTLDGDATMVWTHSGNWDRDLYALTDVTASGGIASVVIYAFVTSCNEGPTMGAATAVKTHGAVFNGTASYTYGIGSYLSTTYTTNPSTLATWTWTEINDLQGGVVLHGTTQPIEVKCSQVYLLVNLVPSPSISTQAATSITGTTATGNGTIVNLNGGGNCDERGFDWGTQSGTYTTSVTTTGSYGTGAYTGSLVSLPAATTIYYRAKAHNSLGWGYGAEASFATTGGAVPVVATSIATSVTQTTALLQGALTSLGDYTPVYVFFQYGLTISYGTTTSEQTKTTTGGFNQAISGLAADATYHFRAVARHGATSYVYGIDMSFTTSILGVPTVTTVAATEITAASAQLQGSIESLGSYSTVYAFFQYGLTVSYGTSTTEQTKTATGGFSQTISGLVEGTTYHYRAALRYGTSQYFYGSGMSFTATTAGEPGVSPPDILRIDDVKVFSSYQGAGDQLYVISFRTIYNSGAPTLDCSDYFDFQLLDGTTVKAQTPVKSWDYKPGSIYLSAGSALPWGGTYKIKIVGTPEKWTTPPEAERTLTSGDWIGINLNQLDTWVISLATSMQSYYNSEMVVYTTGGTPVLSAQGGVVFNMGIPNLSTIRPHLFKTTAGYAEPTLPERENKLQPQLEPRTRLGPYVSGVLEEGGAFVGQDLNTATAWACGILYLVAAVIVGVLTGMWVVGFAVMAPIVLAGMWVGGIPAAGLMLIAAVTVMFVLKAVWLRGT